MQHIFSAMIRHKDEARKDVFAKFFKGEITKEDVLNMSFKTPTPTWAKNLYQLSAFMNKMGIMPHPSFGIEQEQFHLTYEKFRRECKKKIKIC